MDWREDARSLSEVVDKLYSQPGKLLYTDITFILSDGRKVEAHKLILALSSPVFEAEFYGGQWMEESCKSLVIEDDMGVFPEFISLIYKKSFDFCDVSDFQLWDLLYLANKYLINKLIRLLEKTIKTRIKRCKDKVILLNHLERAKEVLIGDEFHEMIKNEIELYAEPVMSSHFFLNTRREEAKEIIEYENLHLTEGQIFKQAAEWCLFNCQTEQEAEKEFNAEFLNLISSKNMTSEDFIQNVLPSSNIMTREAVKRFTKHSFENKTVGMLTRYVLNPMKVISQGFYKAHKYYGKEKCSDLQRFENFDIKLDSFCTSEEQISLQCNITFIPKTEGEHSANLFLKIFCPGKKEKTIRKHTTAISRSNPPITILQDVTEAHSDIAIRLTIATSKFVELEVIRQDLIDAEGYRTRVPSSSVKLECSKKISEATEIIRENFGLKHAKLFCSYSSPGSLFYTKSESLIGYIDFFLSCNNNFKKGRYFLGVSNKPFDISSFDYKVDKFCMIYLKKGDSVVFVRNKIIRAEERREEPMCRLVKYAAGVVQEKDYEVVYGDFQHSYQDLKINWIRQSEAITGNLVYCIVCTKNEK